MRSAFSSRPGAWMQDGAHTPRTSPPRMSTHQQPQLVVVRRGGGYLGWAVRSLVGQQQKQWLVARVAGDDVGGPLRVQVGGVAPCPGQPRHC